MAVASRFSHRQRQREWMARAVLKKIMLFPLFPVPCLSSLPMATDCERRRAWSFTNRAGGVHVKVMHDEGDARASRNRQVQRLRKHVMEVGRHGAGPGDS